MTRLGSTLGLALLALHRTRKTAFHDPALSFSLSSHPGTTGSTHSLAVLTSLAAIPSLEFLNFRYRSFQNQRGGSRQPPGRSVFSRHSRKSIREFWRGKAMGERAMPSNPTRISSDELSVFGRGRRRGWVGNGGERRGGERDNKK